MTLKQHLSRLHLKKEMRFPYTGPNALRIIHQGRKSIEWLKGLAPGRDFPVFTDDSLDFLRKKCHERNLYFPDPKPATAISLKQTDAIFTDLIDRDNRVQRRIKLVEEGMKAMPGLIASYRAEVKERKLEAKRAKRFGLIEKPIPPSKPAKDEK